MSSELEGSRQQLAQVEAALLLTPDDENLKTLAQGLREVIELQEQLTNAAEPKKEAKLTTLGGWSIGDKCEAVWSEDGSYYAAEILGFEGVDQARVLYTEYDDEDVVKLQSLRRAGKQKGGEQPTAPAPAKMPGGTQVVTDPAAAATTATATAAEKPAGEAKGAKARPSKEAEREHKRKKAKRKKEKETQELQLLEKQKNKWKSFATKAKRKKGTGSGKHGKSIFASPDDPSGKVGVGTCGIGGRGMTGYQHRGKWRFEKAGNDEN